MNVLKFTFALSIIGLAFIGCKDKDKKENPEFDKSPIMTNIADNDIIPNQNELKLRIDALSSAWITFSSDQSSTNFDDVKSKYLLCNEQYQLVKLFDLGPAMTNGLTMAFGVFPTDTAQIELNISSGSYDLSTADNVDTQGLDALDYLLFRNNAFAQMQVSANARLYVNDLINKLKGKISTVVSDWNTYRSEFIAGTSNSQTSPFSYLINSFIKDYEITKSTKLGIPLGKATLNVAKPLDFEAKWSGHSKILLQLSVAASSNLFHGIGTGGDGSGFDDYLIAIDRSDLETSIHNQYAYLISEIGTWNDNLSQRLNADRPSLDSYYNYMSALVVNLKTDMPSAFGVVITYQDNDGD